MRRRIALVTARILPDVDADLPLLAERLGREADVDVVTWDDPAVDWSGYDLALIRSTWDYPRRLAEFLAWVEHCAARTRLANPAPVVRWNCDKGYLDELRARGVAVVPTVYVPPGVDPELPEDRQFVVKPAVGAGASDAARYHPDEAGAALAHVRLLHDAGATAMIQPYLSSIDVAGERALVFFGDRYLHAIRKGPVLAPGARHDAVREAHPDLRPWRPSAGEVALARAALAAVPGSERPLYARVDLVSDDAGDPLLLELELIEPNLFLPAHPGSLDAIAAAVLHAAGGTATADG